MKSYAVTHRLYLTQYTIAGHVFQPKRQHPQGKFLYKKPLYGYNCSVEAAAVFRRRPLLGDILCRLTLCYPALKPLPPAGA